MIAPWWVAPALAADDPVVGEMTLVDERPPRVELTAQYGSLHNGDDAWDQFSERDGMPTWGLRAGYRVHDRVAVSVGWDLVRRGATVGVSNWTSSSSTGWGSDDVYVAALVAHQLCLGARVDASIEGVLLPYLGAQGVITPIWLRFDDDPDDPESPGQVSALGSSYGFDVVGGAELRIPPKAPVQVSWSLDAGYAFRTAADFDELGTMRPGGLVVHTGIGLRF